MLHTGLAGSAPNGGKENSPVLSEAMHWEHGPHDCALKAAQENVD